MVGQAGQRGAAFIHLTIPGGVDPEQRNRQRGGRQKTHHGYFLDTATLGGAILGGRPTLARLGELLDTEHRKTEADHGQEITPEYLDYLCSRRAGELGMRGRASAPLRHLPATQAAWEIYSEASIGKAHLEKMGLRPFRELNDWPAEIIATVMETYYGGRAECNVRRTPRPRCLCRLHQPVPDRLHASGPAPLPHRPARAYQQEDPAHVQRLLDELTVEQVLRPDFWRAADPSWC